MFVEFTHAQNIFIYVAMFHYDYFMMTATVMILASFLIGINSQFIWDVPCDI